MANPSYQFRLKISGPTGNQVFDLAQGATSVGRQVGNRLLLNDSLVSRQHARFDCTAEECQVTDLGSANGTTLNGERLVPNTVYSLPHGSRLKMGPFELVVEAELQAAPQSEPSLVSIPVELEPEPEVPPEQPSEEKPIPKDKPKPEKPVKKPQEEPEAAPEIRMKLESLPVDLSSAAPPSGPPGSTPGDDEQEEDGELKPIPGLPGYSTRLITYLPGIYQTDFMTRFLGIFETVLLPLEWSVDNFDLFLSPSTAPADFLPWLQSWYGILFHPSWSNEKRRILLSEAHDIYARRGTRRSLARVLEIYTEKTPVIIDEGEEIEPHTFTVRLPFKRGAFNQEVIQDMIDANKPAHTTYNLEYT